MKKHGEIPWEAIAERKILEAQKEGEFDNLPGLGKPIEVDALEQPWLASWLKHNNLKIDYELAKRLLHPEETI